jgi:hypothetical protein
VVGQFNIGLGNDGHGGTLVTDPPLGTAGVTTSLTITNSHG